MSSISIINKYRTSDTPGREEDDCISPIEMSAMRIFALAVINQAFNDAENKFRTNQKRSLFYPTVEDKQSAKQFLAGGMPLENWAAIADQDAGAMTQAARRRGLIA